MRAIIIIIENELEQKNQSHRLRYSSDPSVVYLDPNVDLRPHYFSPIAAGLYGWLRDDLVPVWSSFALAENNKELRFGLPLYVCIKPDPAYL